MPDRFGDPARLPELSPLTFLDAGHTDRLASLVMTLAAEVWALTEQVAVLSGGSRPDPAQRRAFVRRLVDAVAPEPDPAKPVRELADRIGQTGAEK